MVLSHVFGGDRRLSLLTENSITYVNIVLAGFGFRAHAVLHSRPTLIDNDMVPIVVAVTFLVGALFWRAGPLLFDRTYLT